MCGSLRKGSSDLLLKKHLYIWNQIQNSNLTTANSLASQLIHLVHSLTSSAQRSSFLHLLSTGPGTHATSPSCGSQEPCTHASGNQPIGGISLLGKVQLQTQLSSNLWGNWEPRAKAEKLSHFSPCLVLYKLSVTDSSEIKTDHLKSQIMNPAKGLLATQECSFKIACWHSKYTSSSSRKACDTHQTDHHFLAWES